MNADGTLQATAENGGILLKMYMQEIGKAMTGRKMSRSEATHRVSEEMGESMTPTMSGKEFRSFIAQCINRARYTGHKKTTRKSGGRHSKASGWVMQEIGLETPEADNTIGPLERARLLMKGMSKGETRFEVCLDQEQARSIQAAMTKIVPEMKWRADQPYRSNILGNVTRQAGEARVLLAIQRL
jgi:hypothetical protein